MTMIPNGTSVEATVEALAQAMIVWDDDNYRHCQRTADYAVAIAREMGLGPDAIEHVRLGSLLHDIGKIGVDLALVKKPGALDADERERMKLHPGMGASILDHVLPREIVECAESHHEQPDGLGYPAGLAEADIPLGALICRVADVLDSLTTPQTYRGALSLDDAIAEFRDGIGRRYSERVVHALFDVLQRRAIRPAA